MNITSNRPTSISRLIWDSDLEPRNNRVIKGDLIGRIARYCGLTTDSSSGVVSSTFPSFSLYVGVASANNNGLLRETLTTSSTVSLASFVESLTKSVISSDGTNIYYPEILEGLFFDISYSVKCKCSYDISTSAEAVGYTAKFEFLDSNGLVVYTDTKKGSGEVPVRSNNTVILYDGTFKFPLVRSVSSVRVSFTANTMRGYRSYQRPEIHCSGVNIYFSGV